MNRTIYTIGGGLLLAAAALGLGYFLGHRAAPVAADSAAEGTKQADERDVLYWYDPMVPGQHFEKPGKSPFMDMMLVPRYADQKSGDGVRISSALQQSLGLRTATATRASVASPLRVPGTLQWDPTGEQRVSARVEGSIERVHARTPFARVKRGDALATVLSPALAAALAEYRALLGGRSDQARQLQQAARERLQLWGLSPRDMSSASGPPRIVLRAPVDGVLAEVAVREGDTVMPGQLLFRINATESLWIEARVPQGSAGHLAAGDHANVWIGGSVVPLQGTIDAVLPDVDPATRTQTVRIVVSNQDGRLAAGAFAEIELPSPSDAPRLWIPSEALILTGRAARVIVKQEDDSFRPVPVTTGRQADERTEILSGLVGGEEIVVSGQFLIDSEASLSGLLSRLEPATVTEAAPEAHTTPASVSQRDKKRRVLYWYDPMVPDQHFDEPGKSPFMDMQLVPKYADEVAPPRAPADEDEP